MDGNGSVVQSVALSRSVEPIVMPSAPVPANPSLDRLNRASRERALALVTPLVERSPWVGEAALDARPFDSDEALAAALVEVILGAGAARRVSLFRAHPELGGADARSGRMTPASSGEQERLGLAHLSGEEAERLARLNAAYRRRFHHPFIVALHRVPARAALFRLFETRLASSPLEEHVTALAEIASVIRTRCRVAFGEPGSSPSTHPQRSTGATP